ncbi:MAG: thioesterase domain-containing protein [Acidobacteria bacterium]|nr:thioesterase domain-containing protein [Acidobacteriota bacterium]
MFELGGNSLHLISLVARIHQEFGVETPIAQIFENPTIAGIAFLVNSKNYADSPMMLLNSPAQKKVFLFPPQLPYGAIYKELALLIPNYAFYAFNFIEEEDRLEQYTRLITNIQPQGPYILFGYSAAGTLTFQVAAALEKRGCKVSDIIFIDCFYTEGPSKKINDEFWEFNRKSKGDLMDKWGLSFLKEKVIKKTGSYIKYIDSIEYLEKIDARVHLLLTAQFRNQEQEDAPDTACWNRFSSKETLFYEVQGTHVNVLYPGLVEKNAPVLRNILESIASG